MKLLILGGTQFAGRFLTKAAIDGGHTVTLFNRGTSSPGLFEGQVEALVGDRSGTLELLAGRTFDAVIDMCGQSPLDVSRSVECLSGSAGHYVFISSASVYRDLASPLDEDCERHPPLETFDPDAPLTPEEYGSRKRMSEDAVTRAFSGCTTLVRPGLIVGPHDPTWRFAAWADRLRRGGETALPGDPMDPVQVIDARDLGAWLLHLVEGGIGGVYNATGPAEPTTFGQLFDASQSIWGPELKPVWVPEAVLNDHGVKIWTEMPLWVGAQAHGLHQVSNARAIASGLTHRPLEETWSATADWLASGHGQRDPQFGLDPEREAALLRAVAGLTAPSRG